MTTLTAAPPRNLALTAARVYAGLLGANQIAGAVFFLFLARDQAVWRGPWLDVPIVALLLTGACLKLGVALLPGLDTPRRLGVGFLAVTVGVAVTLVKIPVYDEPEGVFFLLLEGVLLTLLVLAHRAVRR